MTREVVVQPQFETIDESEELHDRSGQQAVCPCGPLEWGAAGDLAPWLDDCFADVVVKLTRLNLQTITVNPDNILWAEASPDTTLCFLGGEKVLVREGMDELIDRVIAFRRMVSSEFPQTRRDVEG